MSWLEILLTLIIVALSGFLASAEIATFSLTRFQIRVMRERFRNSHRRIKRLLADPGGFLISVLVIAEILNVSLSILIAQVVNANWSSILQGQNVLGWFIREKLAHWAPEWALQTLVGTLITTPILLIAIEITPKTIGARANQLISTLSSGPMIALYNAMKPVRFIIQAIIEFFARSKVTGHDENDHGQNNPIKEEEFLNLVEEGHRDGTVQESELEMIKNVFELDDTQVSEIMTPIEQVLVFPSNTLAKTALTSLQSRRYSRIPIVDATVSGGKKVVGILYSKDLLIAKLENDQEVLANPVSMIMRKPMVAHDSTRLNGLFLRMKKQRMHLAVIEDADGNARGVITMNDLLEALFDDLIDEDAADEKAYLAPVTPRTPPRVPPKGQR